MNKLLLGSFFSGLLVLSACSSAPTQSGGSDASKDNPTKEVASFHVADPEPPQIQDKELEEIPLEINERVEKWMQYFQGKGRPHMERYLGRSTRYIQLMKRILRKNGLPEDLVYIALIESGFSSRATSRAAAVGYWQFIKGTGRRYGLEINALVDERRDPVLSTQAAAEYFKGLYSIFGSWYLSMASYNVGENRVKREVVKYYTRDFWVLAKKRRFPRETINYVPKFIAAKIIAKNPEKYGFTEIDYEAPIEFELVRISKPLNLRTMASKMGMEYEELKLLNPKFRGEIAVTKDSGVLELRVPGDKKNVALQAAEQSIVDKVEFVADAGETETYKVRSGDSLYLIARKYRTTVAWLRDSNDLKPGRKLRIGMRLQVPDRGGRKTAQQRKPAKVEKKQLVAKSAKEDSERAASNPEVVTSQGVYYIVQPGDTLTAIADDYDSTISVIKKMNKLGKGSMIRAGMKLRVPKDEAMPNEVDTIIGDTKIDQKRTVAQQTPGAVASAIARPASIISHVVRPGENLTTIAKQYGVSIDAIKKINKLKKRATIRVGNTLLIPSTGQSATGTTSSDVGSTNRKSHLSKVSSNISLVKMKRNKHISAVKVHVVKRGENLNSIASRYDVTLNAIRSKNKISNGNKLLVGAKIIIPTTAMAY